MNRITEALTEIQQAQQALLINLQTFLRSGGREAAARLDSAIADEQQVVERWSKERRDYLAKP